MDGQPGNKIKTLIWSVVAIVFGVTLSAFIVGAFSKKTPSIENAPVVATTEVAQEVELSSKKEFHESKLFSFFQKIKHVTITFASRGASAFTGVDFEKVLVPPQAKYFLKDEDLLPKVGASAYVVGDVDTGEIILEKNAEDSFPIASVTKLMTALVSLEDLNQESYARVSERAYETLGTSGNLRQGEKMKVSDLLYPLLLVSSNDAAEVLSEENGRDSFLRLMNDTAKSLGMIHTNYEDPSGLSPHNYSTGRDLFTLAHYLFENHKTVFDITGLEKFSLGNRTWMNANRFSERDDYIGGKTGYTDAAQRTGIAIFSQNFEDYGKRNIAIVLLKTKNRTEDINNILNYLQKNVYLSYETEERRKETVTVDLGFVGDVMLDRGVKTSIYKNFEGDFHKIFDKATFLETPDIMFANLEGPISDKGHNVGSKYSFRMEPAAVSAIKDSGIDIVSFANNHVGDYSTEAFLDTLGRLSEGSLLYAGAGENYLEASAPKIIERSDIKIGYLAVSDVGPEWLKATEKNPGILLASDPKLPTIISEAKKLVDILVVSIHWGEEYKPHTKRQETLAHKMIDAGADIIAGSHPHVTQDVAEYKEGLIFYSLGNFVFDQSFSKETMQGMLAHVVVNKKGIVSHEEEMFKLNSFYQPYLEETPEVSENIFSMANCPVGNEEADYSLFDSNLENSVGKYIPAGLVEIQDVLKTKDGREICLTEDTANHLKEMVDAAKKAGAEIIVTSGFRSFDTQKTLYDNSRGTRPETDNESIAPPGHSEHQLGTTIDLTSPDISSVSAAGSFKDTKEFAWLSKNAYKYGFVMSYPANGNTGYIYEPWHFRYLGTDIAKEIRSKDITTQEYLETL